MASEEEEPTDAANEHDIACTSCGADLKYKPGISALKCPYCSAENEIETIEDIVGEQDFREVLANAEEKVATHEVTTAKCDSCGASSTYDPNVATDSCPFCGTTITVQAETSKLIKPQSLLPFKVPKDDAKKSFRDWLSGLWFAPNKLKKMKNAAQGMQGVFLPHWTYDSQTTSSYVGQRGIYYWVNESYTTTDSKGKSIRRTRRVRKTRWYPAHGIVQNAFDDILVIASESLPKKYVAELEPWGLEDLVSYDSRYISGFKSETYTVDLETGFQNAEQQMDPTIRQTIRRDIGGDTQRIHHFKSSHSDITFKHILLPVWMSAYRYQEKVYRFVVNARTGEVQGERPWSAVKIAAAIIGGLAIIGGIVWYVQTH